MAVAVSNPQMALFARLKTQTLKHPYCRELEQGALPLSKIIKYQSDTLWLITSFPEYVAALASRCPRYEHEYKAKLLKNAWDEHDHPQMMARFLKAAGADPDPIVNGPEEAYEPSWQMRNYRNWLELNAFHRPWLEAVSVFSIGVEYVVMPQILMTRHALEERYHFKKADLGWFYVHSSEEEVKHGDAGLKMLDAFARSEAERDACLRAVEQTFHYRAGVLDAAYVWQQ